MRRFLLMNVALLYAILVGVNLPAPRLGLSFDEDISGTRLWYEPPGWVIPLVWWVLFTLLGLARYELGKARSGQTGRTLIVGLALLCASYAYYTLGLTKLTGGTVALVRPIRQSDRDCLHAVCRLPCSGRVTARWLSRPDCCYMDWICHRDCARSTACTRRA